MSNALATSPSRRAPRRNPLTDRWHDVLTNASPWRPPAVPTTICVPHPDDEILSTGGLLAHQSAAGVPVRVVAVTDGEGAYPDRGLDVDLAAIRRREQNRALEVLGVSTSCVTRLGLPDGRVADHEDELVDRLIDLLRPQGLVVAPASVDHHCDHVAVGRAAAAATARCEGAVMVESLFWAWHHAAEADVAGRALLRLDLSTDVQRRRSHALAHHRSQVGDELTEPLLGEGDLEPVRWPAEYFLTPEAP